VLLEKRENLRCCTAMHTEWDAHPRYQKLTEDCWQQSPHQRPSFSEVQQTLKEIM